MRHLSNLKKIMKLAIVVVNSAHHETLRLDVIFLCLNNQKIGQFIHRAKLTISAGNATTSDRAETLRAVRWPKVLHAD